MHRLLVDRETLNEENPRLPADAARHLRVVRPRDGEEIELFDGRGSTRLYVFKPTGAHPLEAKDALKRFEKAAGTLTLFACVTKGSRWDWTIEKATELGVTRIVPVLSERTIVRLARDERPAKRERWQRIAEDAARQSDAVWVPEVASAVDFAEALRLARETTCFIGALTNPASPPLARAVAERPTASDLAVFIGPEGDFTPDELAALMKIGVPTSFGPTILRAETAALYALSVLSAVASAAERPLRPENAHCTN